MHYITLVLPPHACRATRPTSKGSRTPDHLRIHCDVFTVRVFRPAIQLDTDVGYRCHRIILFRLDMLCLSANDITSVCESYSAYTSIHTVPIVLYNSASHSTCVSITAANIHTHPHNLHRQTKTPSSAQSEKTRSST